MLTWLVLLLAVTAVAVELVLLERDRQWLRAQSAVDLAGTPGADFLRRLLRVRPRFRNTAPDATIVGPDAGTLAETTVSDFDPEVGGNAPSNLRLTLATLLQRLGRDRPPRHAARDVVYWINLGLEKSAPAVATTATSAPSPPEYRLQHLPAPHPDAAARVEVHSTEQEATRDRTAAAALPPTVTSPEDGIMYVDAAGHFTFANQTARELLHWTSGELALSDVLVGGSGESTALLEAVARQELIQQRTVWRAGSASLPLDVSALALRDRDGNLWGAALFIRRPAAA